MAPKKRWGKIGPPKSAKRKAWMRKIARKANPRRRRRRAKR